MEYVINENKLSENEIVIKSIANNIKNIDINISFSETTGSVPTAIKEYAKEIELLRDEMAEICFRLSGLIGKTAEEFDKTDQVASQDIKEIGPIGKLKI